MLGQAERLYQLNSILGSKKNVYPSRIIAITSGKGGTGKSFVASNLALSLSKKNVKVLLVDLDLNFANQGVLFNLSKKKSIYHYMTYNSDLSELINNYDDNLDLILGESGKIDHPKFNDDKVKTLFSDLKSLGNGYDIIILDTSSGIDNGSLEILLKSDEIILVASPEPTSVMDGYVILKLLKSYGSNVEKNLIINKVFTPAEASEAFDNLQKAASHFLKTEINYLGSLSFSEEVVRSIRDQKPIINSGKSNQITDQFEKITSKLSITTIG